MTTPNEDNLKETEENQENTESTTTEEKSSESTAAMTPEEEIAALNDKFVRLYSEFDNYKKRTTKERFEFFQSVGKDVIVSLLPVLDDFERALKSIETSNDIEALKSGVNLVYHKLNTTLEARGLKSFESKDKPFDVDFHEAVTKFPVEDESKKGHVIDELEKGYLLNDKVIRFAKVVIGE